MRFEGKSVEQALETAARELERGAQELSYRVIRDEKSFWGGRVVEIEVEGEPPGERAAEASAEAPAERPPTAEPATDDEAAAVVESTLTELLSAAGLLVEIRRRLTPGELVFELFGDDVEGLLTNRGEGLNGLEVLAGRIAGRRLERPVYPRVDAEGFRAHQKESLEELALRSAAEAKRTHRPQLLPPLPPRERRLVHLALAADPEVETESEGEGFLKRVAVRPRAS